MILSLYSENFVFIFFYPSLYPWTILFIKTTEYRFDLFAIYTRVDKQNCNEVVL